ncbi:Ribonuclease/ribotoxin [Elaphomyces granulatus]
MVFLKAFILLFFLAVQCLAQIIPYAYYDCLDNGRLTGISYAARDILAAIQEGIRRHQNGQGARWGNREYPHGYNYWPGNWALRDQFVLEMDPRVAWRTNTMIEYPLVQGGVYRGGNPGPDRVIFDGVTRAFIGVLTHRGPGRNNFYPCEPANFPRIQNAVNFVLPVFNPANNPGLINYPWPRGPGGPGNPGGPGGPGGP